MYPQSPPPEWTACLQRQQARWRASLAGRFAGCDPVLSLPVDAPSKRQRSAWVRVAEPCCWTGCSATSRLSPLGSLPGAPHRHRPEVRQPRATTPHRPRHLPLRWQQFPELARTLLEPQASSLPSLWKPGAPSWQDPATRLSSGCSTPCRNWMKLLWILVLCLSLSRPFPSQLSSRQASLLPLPL